MKFLARLRAWFVSSVIAPDLVEPSGVDIALDEEELFDARITIPVRHLRRGGRAAGSKRVGHPKS